MQSFKGSLASYRLSLVVPALFEAEPVTGTLVLEQGSIRRHFAIRRGALLSVASNAPREHLAQVLADLGILDVPRAAAAFTAAEEAGVPFGTLLVDRGWVERPRLLEALAHKAREAFFDCYQWESGEMEYVPGLPPWSEEAVSLDLRLDHLHRDALARMREWRIFRDAFPEDDAQFHVFREAAADWSTPADEELLTLAERGASLAEMLASAKEGKLLAARRVLRMYRTGVLSHRVSKGPRVGEAVDVGTLISLAQQFLRSGAYDSAAAIAAQVLEAAPVAEAQALYREAERLNAFSVRSQASDLMGRLRFNPMPRRPPPELTADDLYVYSRLQSAPNLAEALKAAAMGETAAYRALLRLIASGLIHVEDETDATAPRPSSVARA